MTTDQTAGTALLTDHYELTMVRGALHSGAAHRRSVFEMFARHLPNGRRYGVVAGTARLLDALEQFRFSDAELSFLERGPVTDAVLASCAVPGLLPPVEIDGEHYWDGGLVSNTPFSTCSTSRLNDTGWRFRLICFLRSGNYLPPWPM